VEYFFVDYGQLPDVGLALSNAQRRRYFKEGISYIYYRYDVGANGRWD